MPSLSPGPAARRGRSQAMPSDADHHRKAIGWRDTAVILASFVATMLITGVLIFGTFSLLEAIVH